MATYQLNNFNFSFAVRKAPKMGPTSSDKWNDTVDEIGKDLANIAQEWNLKLVPIITGLPNGDDDTAVNAFVNGLDGANLWVDQNVTSSSAVLTYYNAVKLRPNTVKEQFDGVYSYISNAIDTVQQTVTASAGGLTSDQKTRIGSNIFNSSSVSSPTSLDGKSEYNRLNIIQVANDLYGSEIELNNNGDPILDNSVKDMVGALLAIHNGSWSSDITVDHVGVVHVTQADVDSLHPGSDTFPGSFSSLSNDLDAIRSIIKTLKGTGGWLTTNSSLYGVGLVTSLETLLTTVKGSASKSAGNPWGYSYTDIDNLLTILNAMMAFCGQNSLTDSSPGYSSHAYISDGNSLETAAGKLDAAVSALNTALMAVSGLLGTQTFTNLTDVPHSYTGYAGNFLQVNGTETGISFSSSPVTPGQIYGDLSPKTITTTGTMTYKTYTNTSVVSSGNCILISGALYVLQSGMGVVLPSQNGTNWRITVDNTGALVTTAV